MSADELIARFELRESPVAVRDLPGWKKPTKIVVLADKPDRVAWLQRVAPGVQLLPTNSAAAAVELVKDADAAIGICSRELFHAGSALRWVQAATAGVEQCVDSPELRSREIILTNAQRVGGPSIAEHAVALMFSLTRGIASSVEAQAAEEWGLGAAQAEKMLEVEGRTMLVVGLGGVGTEVARRAHGLGMNVIATRASDQSGPDFVSYVGKPTELPALVERADVIVNAVPLTPETTGMFNAALFARMQRSAIFINVGRGGSVVQSDLIAALRKGQIGGAGLDVTTPEPLPKGDPLWKAPNLLITPHVAGMSEQIQKRIWILMRENLRRYVAGERMLSVVDVKRGY